MPTAVNYAYFLYPQISSESATISCDPARYLLKVADAVCDAVVLGIGK
ncbi:hypothetical protein [Nostoc sp.]